MTERDYATMQGNPGGLGGRVMLCRMKRWPPPNASPIEFELGTWLIGGRQPQHTAQYSLGPQNPRPSRRAAQSRSVI